MARIEPDVRIVEEIQSAGGDTVKKCYQCATCATVCPLSQDEMPFPRKQMLMGQWGLKERLLSDPSIWLCHQCGDCTVYCPRGAKPGDVLGALRNMAVRELSEFKFLWTFYNKPWGLPIIFLIAFFFVFLSFSFFFGGIPGIFSLDLIPVLSLDVHESVRRVLMVDAIFVPLAAFVVVMAGIGINRMWNGMCQNVNIPAAYQKSLWGILKIYLVPAIKEILAHSRFRDCGANQWRFNGHRMLLWSFIILAFVTGVVFIAADVFGFHTPWPLYNPIKILANIGAILLLYGVISLIANRSRASAEGKLSSSYQDWFLIYLILAVGVTGLLTEILRLVHNAFYPGMYALHLIAVFMLFLSIPYSKFAHLIYRTTAYVFDLYVKDVRAQMAALEVKEEASPQEEVKEEAPEEASQEESSEETKAEGNS
ncbi:quinone-interacting membrane-bound oxidoreductase complex subunit QmoC [Thermosulfurimonas dismutans]|uniref:Adenylylsulfate reductase-associated electron transfer protein QmoC n=1 Tax=Thermosulfurimonas dismutans TaxID=999894 RepID=A0A179D2L6_9BACT|nr:quinone-interacting membrane-bound oxidoreductase complex subunit QmoC [Thermosulfurimonas dismutans]OAQ20315.1 Adenylylsulfate reductase-associated electron transfer protein QmoC [Thermosulfurimonas dismutans]